MRPRKGQQTTNEQAKCFSKVKYPSKAKAEIGAARITAKYGTPMDWYKCPVCGSRHLTQKNKNKSVRELIAAAVNPNKTKENA